MKTTEGRQLRGLQIANTSRITKIAPDCFLVPAQGGPSKYRVKLDAHNPSCTCPDCQTRDIKCKHIWAVEYHLKHEKDGNGTETVTKTMKVTYSQDWPNYNKAQMNEKAMFMKLLADLCKSIPNDEYTFGRPKLSKADMVFCAAFKVFSGYSGRRFTSDMKFAKEKGYIDRIPHFNSVFNYLKDEDIAHILHNLITKTSLPLKSIESDFAVDSSGFSTSRFDRWFDYKYGREKVERIWIKTHLMCGVKTNIITGVELTDATGADSPQFSTLVNRTAENFEISEVSADKAYSSKMNLKMVDDLGAMPYIPFRKNVTDDPARIRTTNRSGHEFWTKMFYYFQLHNDEFMEHYHKRSNVETTFHMIKSKFGDSVKSRTKIAQKNEVLCKILCHNICVLIQSMFEFGINESLFPVQYS
jgi:transposase